MTRHAHLEALREVARSRASSSARWSSFHDPAPRSRRTRRAWDRLLRAVRRSGHLTVDTYLRSRVTDRAYVLAHLVHGASLEGLSAALDVDTAPLARLDVTAARSADLDRLELLEPADGRALARADTAPPDLETPTAPAALVTVAPTHGPTSAAL